MILGFPRAKQGLCHTKHMEAGGIILWALLTVFLVSKVFVLVKKNLFKTINSGARLQYLSRNLPVSTSILSRLSIKLKQWKSTWLTAAETMMSWDTGQSSKLLDMLSDFYAPLEKGGILFCNCGSVGLFVCRPSVVRSISFDPFT